MSKRSLQFVLGLLLLGVPAFAVPATDCATVQPGGPRDGANGKHFFNVEGPDKGKYASYAVADFKVPAGAADQFSAIHLTLYHAPSRFTNAGSFDVWVVSGVDTRIDPSSDIRFVAAGPDWGFAEYFGERLSLVKGVEYAGDLEKGEPFVIKVPVSPIEAAVIRSKVSDEGQLRLILTPATSTVAATFFGVRETAPEIAFVRE